MSVGIQLIRDKRNNFMEWSVDPVAISFLGLKIHWYGILFAIAIISGFQVMKAIYKNEKMPIEQLDALLTNSVIGIIVGARLFHCLFYDPLYFWSHPLKIFAIWEGGLASHGGGLGLLVVVFLYTRKYNLSRLWLLDRLAISTALFGFFVRLANFINSEILGIPTNVAWGVTFKRIDILPRHPVQLYEAFAYLSIFVLLWWIYKNSKVIREGSLLGLFLSLTFIARFILEFFKEKQASYASDLILTTGQLLSIPFIIVGVFLLVWSSRKSKVNGL